MLCSQKSIKNAAVNIGIISLFFCLLNPQISFLFALIGMILILLAVKLKTVYTKGCIVFQGFTLVIASVAWIYWEPLILI